MQQGNDIITPSPLNDLDEEVVGLEVGVYDADWVQGLQDGQHLDHIVHAGRLQVLLPSLNQD